MFTCSLARGLHGSGQDFNERRPAMSTRANEGQARSRDDQPVRPGTAKDPREWITGNEPMTGPQESYLNTLAREAGEQVDPDLTKAEASEKIEELQEKTGRGQ
jgi:hypothetical protein